MKNTIKNNLVAAEAIKKAEEAARKAALKAEQEAAAAEAEKAKVEEFAKAHASVDLATIKNIIDAAKKGELFFIAMGHDGLVADYATSEKDARKHVEWIYKSARKNKEELLLDSSSIMCGMMEMQRKFQIAHDAIEAGLIPEDVIIDENNIEHWIVGNKAYSIDGVEEANLDDLETNLSTKDRKILLKERIKKYQEELEKLEAEDEVENHKNDDWPEDYYYSESTKVKTKNLLKEQHLKDIIKEFYCYFKEKSLNASWQSQENSFKDYLESQLDLTFIPSPSNTTHRATYLIAKYDYDDEGVMIPENICIYKRVIGVYGGCSVQLKDVNGDEIAKLGRIW